MTNLEKLKSQITNMDAEEFVCFVYNEPCCSVSRHRGDIKCRETSCYDCYVKWLNEESEEK